MSTDAQLKPNVLVVDDTPVNLRVMRGLLAKLECEVVTADSAAAALAAVAERDFALFLLDVQMPEMDGFQLAAKFAESPRTREVPIIFVTAAYGEEIRISGYKAGAVDYVSKPFEPFIMLSKVQVFLDLYRGRMEMKHLLDLLNERNRQLETEVAERAHAEGRALHRATHDPLTELPNRLLFMDRLERAFVRTRREGLLLALLYIDLDRFKPVNDRYGHQAGDELLKLIAARLLAPLRKMDTVARLGGDEFAIILEGINAADEAQQLATRIEQSLSEPFMLASAGGSVEAHIGASIGVAVHPGDADSVDALIRAADQQMYLRKRSRAS